MAQICIPVLALMLLCTIGLFSTEVAAARKLGCCTMYSKMVVPKTAIKGFTIQTNQEKCRIDAVILHTVKGRNICVAPYEKWLTKVMDELRTQFQVLRAKPHKTQ